MESFYNEKYWVQRAMIERGGGFVRNLGEALTHCTEVNAKLIKENWPDFWEDYLNLAKNIFHDEMVKLGDLSEDEAITPSKPKIQAGEEFIVQFQVQDDQLVKIEWDDDQYRPLLHSISPRVPDEK